MDKSYKEDSEIKVSIKKKGPGYIYSGDIKSDAEVVYDKIPLTLLKEDQEIDLKGVAKLGKGSYHTKHAPGFMFYRNVAEVSLPKKVAEEIRKVCPSSQIKEKGDKIVVTDNQAKPLVDLCQAIAEKNKESVEVKFGDELIITVESFGQLASKEIFKESIEHLKKDLQAFSKQIK
jgi:DNA-directed RNA polymerase alpha subunit